ncbi:hypothetical protein QR510_29985, partial [Escherichia coli]|uniref:hypothetical protein n=1 Tax=Escherichia coli TaxID=562 RepID=UPI002751EA91|nr:hypothetical protein [Escherichia coli]
MALSSDYVIGVAPGISAKAAGASAALVADRTLVLSLITGSIALILGYVMVRRSIVPANPMLLQRWQSQSADNAEQQV